jgi:hypothetical protein
MADAAHYFGGDLQSSAAGDLLPATSVLECNQRILRRLLTNKTDYIWQPGYGAGLPARVGSTIDESEMESLIASQMYLETAVVQNPAPQITTSDIANGLQVDITYMEQDQTSPVTLSFDVTP